MHDRSAIYAAPGNEASQPTGDIVGDDVKDDRPRSKKAIVLPINLDSAQRNGNRAFHQLWISNRTDRVCTPRVLRIHTRERSLTP